MKCSCGHEFPPSAETFHAPQLFCDSTGVYLYVLLFNCPRVKENGERCGSTRCLTMYDATGDEDERLEPIAAE